MKCKKVDPIQRTSGPSSPPPGADLSSQKGRKTPRQRKACRRAERGHDILPERACRRIFEVILFGLSTRLVLAHSAGRSPDRCCVTTHEDSSGSRATDNPAIFVRSSRDHPRTGERYRLSAVPSALIRSHGSFARAPARQPNFFGETRPLHRRNSHRRCATGCERIIFHPETPLNC